MEQAFRGQEGAAGDGAGGPGANTREPTRQREFPHLDEPAEDAEEPVLAVHRAPYAVSPGHLLLLVVVLIPTRRGRRGIAVHDLPPPARRSRAGSRRRRREARGPGAPCAAPATAPPAARSSADLRARPIHPSGLGAELT